MPDTEQTPQPGDRTPALIDAHVRIDSLGPFPAKLDPAVRWNGWVCPRFDLDTVRKIAERTQEMAEEYGHDSVPTVHVIDGGTRRHEPRVVVAVVSWQYFEDPEDASRATDIVTPDADGLYGIGACEWTWYRAEPDPAPDADADPRP